MRQDIVCGGGGLKPLSEVHDVIAAGDVGGCDSRQSTFKLIPSEPETILMTRMTALAAMAAATLSAPAFAAEPATTADANAAAALSTALSQATAARQAQIALVNQGYTNVSELGRDDNGRFVGTAVKDGKTVLVSIDMRRPPAADLAH
jgi:hypothetical protein